MRNVYTQKQQLWKPDLNEPVKMGILIDPSFREDEKKIRLIKIWRGSKAHTFYRKKNQIPFCHVTKEAELDTYRHHFSLFEGDEHFEVVFDPFTFTPILRGYYNDLWV